MKKPFVYCVAVLLGIFGAMTAKAQDVSQADKDRALVYLKSSEKGVLDATKGLSDGQWNFKPGPDRWSVAEVMEHLAILKRWFYRSNRIGEIFFADNKGVLPFRRIVRGISRVFRGEKPGITTDNRELSTGN